MAAVDAADASQARIKAAVGDEDVLYSLQGERHPCHVCRPFCGLPILGAGRWTEPLDPDASLVMQLLRSAGALVVAAAVSAGSVLLGVASAPFRGREIASYAVALTPTRLISTEEACLDTRCSHVVVQRATPLAGIALVDNGCCGDTRLYFKDAHGLRKLRAEGTAGEYFAPPDVVLPCLRDPDSLVAAVDDAVKGAAKAAREVQSGSAAHLTARMATNSQLRVVVSQAAVPAAVQQRVLTDATLATSASRMAQLLPPPPPPEGAGGAQATLAARVALMLPPKTPPATPPLGASTPPSSTPPDVKEP